MWANGDLEDVVCGLDLCESTLVINCGPAYISDNSRTDQYYDWSLSGEVHGDLLIKN